MVKKIHTEVIKISNDRVDTVRHRKTKFYSRDTDAFFEFVFQNKEGKDILLDKSYEVKVLMIFLSDKSRKEGYATVLQDSNKAIYEFDTSLINKFEYVNMYIYLLKDGESIDTHLLGFKVDLSEIDKHTDGNIRDESERDQESFRQNYGTWLQQEVQNYLGEIDIGGGGDPSIPSEFPETEVFTQTIPSDVWDITHALRKYPTVTVVDSNRNVVVGDVQYISLSKVRVNFSSRFSGQAILN